MEASSHPSTSSTISSENQPPKVSVVIPIFDRTVILEEAILSILNQTFQDFELILVTDGSPDETMDVVYKFATHPKVRLFGYPDKSGSAVRGRNRGIKEARGEWIAFLDSDDIAEYNRLELSLRYAEKYDVDMVYGYWTGLVCGENHTSVTNGQVVGSPEMDLKSIMDHNVPCQSTVMVKTKKMHDIGGFRESLGYLEDWCAWIMLAQNGCRFKVIPRPLCKLRIHDGNLEKKVKPNFEQYKAIMMEEISRPRHRRLRVAYVVPGLSICGGIAVVLQHANRLRDRGHFPVIVSLTRGDCGWFPENKVPVITVDAYQRLTDLDCVVATGWQTEKYLKLIPADKRFYFVQSDERRFDAKAAQGAHTTYLGNHKYITEARWIQSWLKEEFGHDAMYVPNGIDLKMFYPWEGEKPWTRPRVMIEGPVEIEWKGVEDCYNALKELQVEIGLVTPAGEPPPGWQIRRKWNRVPLAKMRDIYTAHDAFLKMSRIEGFFGPPLEAMACGVPCVVGKVTGCEEYVVEGLNALVIEPGDVENARRCVRELLSDREMYDAIRAAGLQTATEWPWDRSIDLLEEALLHG